MPHRVLAMLGLRLSSAHHTLVSLIYNDTKACKQERDLSLALFLHCREQKGAYLYY